MTNLELKDNILDAITKLRQRDVYIDNILVSPKTYFALWRIVNPKDNNYRDYTLTPNKLMINGVDVNSDMYMSENRVFALENGELRAVFEF